MHSYVTTHKALGLRPGMLHTEKQGSLGMRLNDNYICMQIVIGYVCRSISSADAAVKRQAVLHKALDSGSL